MIKAILPCEYLKKITRQFSRFNLAIETSVSNLHAMDRIESSRYEVRKWCVFARLFCYTLSAFVWFCVQGLSHFKLSFLFCNCMTAMLPRKGCTYANYRKPVDILTKGCVFWNFNWNNCLFGSMCLLLTSQFFWQTF